MLMCDGRNVAVYSMTITSTSMAARSVNSTPAGLCSPAARRGPRPRVIWDRPVEDLVLAAAAA
jgi:hypothetical protein